MQVFIQLYQGMGCSQHLSDYSLLSCESLLSDFWYQLNFFKIQARLRSWDLWVMGSPRLNEIEQYYSITSNLSNGVMFKQNQYHQTNKTILRNHHPSSSFSSSSSESFSFSIFTSDNMCEIQPCSYLISKQRFESIYNLAR